MAEEREILLSVTIDNQKASKQLAAVERELIALKKQRSELNKRLKDNNELTEEEISQKIQLELELKKLNQIRKRSIEQVQAEANSTNALRAEIRRLNDERNNLNRGTEEGEKRFQELTTRLNQLNDSLRDSSKQAGQFKDNVGNYTESVVEAIQQTNLFGVATGGVSTAIGGLGNALKTLLLNPIGLAITAIATLLNAFSKTEEGADSFRVIFAQLNEIANAILKPFLGFAKFLTGTLIKALDVVIKFIGPVVEGITNIVSTAAKVGGAFISATTVVDTEFLESLERSQREAEKLPKTIADLERNLIAVEKQIRKNQLQNARDLNTIEQLKNIRDDETKSIEARLRANEKAAKLETERANRVVELREKEVQILKQQLAVAEDGTQELELREKLLEAQLGLEDARGESLGIQNELITNQVGLIREVRDAQLEVNELQLELQIQQGKIAEGSAKELELRQELVDEQLKTNLLALVRNRDLQKRLSTQTNEQIIATLNEANRLAKQFGKAAVVNEQELTKIQLEAGIARGENQKKFTDAQIEASKTVTEAIKEEQARRLEDQRAFLDLQILQTSEGTRARIEAIRLRQKLEEEQLTEGSNQRLLLEEQNRRQIAELNAQFTEQELNGIAKIDSIKLDNQVQFNEESIKIDEVYYDKKDQNRKKDEAAERARIQRTADLLGQGAALFQEDTIAFKFLASSQALINTYLGVSQALTQKGVPFPIKLIQAGIAFAQGIKTVQEIRNVQTEGFKDGGFTGIGAVNEVAGVVHKGEYVVPANIVSSPKFAPTIAGLESARVKGFQDGGFVDRTGIQNINDSFALQDTIRQSATIAPSPVVTVKDISKANNRVQVKQNISRL